MKEKLPAQYFNGKEFRLYPNHPYFTNGRIRMHIYVWQFYNGKVPKGYHIHHQNENKWDNSIENLVMIKGREHSQYHAKKRFDENPELFKKFQEAGTRAAAANKAWRSTPEGKAFHSRIGAIAYANAKYHKYTCQVCGKEFESNSLHSGPESKRYPKYCHLNCRQRAGKRRKRGVDIRDKGII